jgi:hypothetical protein
MRVWNGEPDASMAHALLFSCKFLSRQDPGSLQLQSADSVLNDCFCRLCDPAVGLSRAAIPAAIADLLSIFASRHFILSALSVSPCLLIQPPSSLQMLFTTVSCTLSICIRPRLTIFRQDVHRCLQLNRQLKGSTYALRKIVFLLSFASALTDEKLQVLVGYIRGYGEFFLQANEEAPAKAAQARVLIQEIN